jgi:hypothetical protein
MSLARFRVALAAVAVAAIAFAIVAAFRTDLTVAGVGWQAYLCMALGAFFTSLLTKEIKP